MLNNLPEKRDHEVDVVAIGSGAGGLSAAITAHDHGAKALVVEKSPQLGGVTALSMGEVWVAGNHLAEADGIEDSVDAGYGYLRSLSMGYGNDLLILNKVVHARMGGTAIPSNGLLTDHHSRVIGWDDKPIDGLYAAGNSVARMETGAVMQSGVSNARGMTHGWLAARHACGDPSPLLEQEVARLGL